MSGLEIAAELADVRRQRPPRAELRVTLRLTSSEGQAGWVLVPDTLIEAPRSLSTGVLSLGAWLLGERATLPLLRATADVGWFAVFVPAAGTATVLDLPLAWWGQLPDAVDLPAYLVSDLRVGGVPVAEALSLALPDAAGTDRSGDAGVLADPAAIRASVSGTPHEPLLFSWTAEDSVVTRLDLAGPGLE